MKSSILQVRKEFKISCLSDYEKNKSLRLKLHIKHG